MCCISVSHTIVPFLPKPNGNTSYLGQIVISAVDGGTWFIDINGRGILLSAPIPRVYKPTPIDGELEYIIAPTWLMVPDPDDFPAPTYDVIGEMSKRIHLKRGTEWITYGPGRDYIVSYVGGVARFYFSPKVNYEIIEIHVTDYPAMPYPGYTQDDPEG